MEKCKTELAEQETRLQAKVNERDQKKLVLSNQQEAAERRKKALTAVTTLQAKKTIAEQNRATQQAIADSSLASGNWNLQESQHSTPQRNRRLKILQSRLKVNRRTFWSCRLLYRRNRMKRMQ